jgi:esterase/lipase superfamily enzyme
MGGQVFLRAFSRFRSSFDQVKQVRFGTVIFAAPDVSQSVFNEKINDITPYSRKKRGVSVYASSLDRVLLLSSYLRGGKPRAGDLSRDIKFESKNVNVIDATRPAWWCDPTQYSFLGHTYFSNNEAVLQDIISRLMPSWKRREAPAQRFSKSDKCWYSSTDKSAAAVPAQQ